MLVNRFGKQETDIESEKLCERSSFEKGALTYTHVYSEHK